MEIYKRIVKIYNFIFSLIKPEIVIGIIVLSALFYKIKLMQPAATGSAGSIYLAVFKHDAFIFAMMLLLYFFGKFLPDRVPIVSKALARFCFILCFGLVILFLADVFAYYFFSTRLYVSDVITFSTEVKSAFTLLRSGWKIFTRLSFLKIAFIAVGALITLRSFSILILKPEQIKRYNRLSLTAAILLLSLYIIPIPSYLYPFGDKPLFENFIERNKNFFIKNNFSDEFRAQLLSASMLPDVCNAGKKQQINVILLVVESLSAYHSKFFSGVNDWTPKLDKIAAKETALTNFHANGWTTIGGLISLLTRSFPFVPENAEFNKWGSPRFSDYDNFGHSIASDLAELGYVTEFIAAGDLSFLGQDNWLKEIGFQNLIGDGDPRFSCHKVRGPFNSVPDKILLDVALEELRRMPPDRPHFVVIQTFWSHRPFMSPDGSRVDSEEAVIKETDAQIASFYEKLLSEGYFEKGLLFITGDHRAMEPFNKTEFDRFGKSAISHIPGIVATRAIKLPQIIEQNFQQRDFGTSINSIIKKSYCLEAYEGNFLSNPPIPGDCIMHSCGDDRDLIFVKCGSQEGAVRISGDRTCLVSGTLNNEASLIQTINLNRLRPAIPIR